MEWTEPARSLPLLLPVFVKLFARYTRIERRGIFFDSGGERSYAETYTNADDNVVCVRGEKEFVKHFASDDGYGQAGLAMCQHITLLAATFLHLFQVAAFFLVIDWQSRDVVPWIWFLQQSSATTCWMTARLVGKADVGRTEHILAMQLKEKGSALLWGKGCMGVEVKIEIVEVKDEDDAKRKILEWQDDGFRMLSSAVSPPGIEDVQSEDKGIWSTTDPSESLKNHCKTTPPTNAPTASEATAADDSPDASASITPGYPIHFDLHHNNLPQFGDRMLALKERLAAEGVEIVLVRSELRRKPSPLLADVEKYTEAFAAARAERLRLKEVTGAHARTRAASMR